MRTSGSILNDLNIKRSLWQEAFAHTLDLALLSAQDSAVVSTHFSIATAWHVYGVLASLGKERPTTLHVLIPALVM